MSHWALPFHRERVEEKLVEENHERRERRRREKLRKKGKEENARLEKVNI